MQRDTGRIRGRSKGQRLLLSLVACLGLTDEESATKMIASHASRPTTIHPLRAASRPHAACLPLSRPAGTRLKDTAMSGGWPAWSPGATRTSGACDRPCAAVDSSTTQRCPRSARSRDGREETQRLHLTQSRGCCGVLIEERQAVSDAWGVLSAWRGRPAGTPFGFSVWALPVVMAATGGASCLSLVSLCIC